MGQKSKNKKRRIVKLQLSVATNDPSVLNSALPAPMQRKMLMYDKSREWKYEGSVTPEIVALMGDKDKLYVWARKNGPMVDVDTTVPCDQNQNW